MFRYARRLARSLFQLFAPATHEPRHGIAPRQRSGSKTYWARRQHRLLPAQVRRKRFNLTRLGRRGLDPAEVHQFLHHVADEMNALYRDLALSQEHATRLRNALREWQAHARRLDEHHRRYYRPPVAHHVPVQPPYPHTRFTA